MPLNLTSCAIVLVVLAAHAGLLWRLSQPGLGLQSGREGAATRQVWRLVPSNVRPAPDDQSPPPNQSVLIAAATEPVKRSEANGISDPEAPGQAPLERPATPAPTKWDAARGFEAGYEDYLPRSKLSAAPRPLADVQVPFPEEVTGLVDLRVNVTLFVDEQGTVRHVRLDSADVAPAFALAILDTFLNARFKPGEVMNVPVRSQVRLEIEFRIGQGH